LRTSYNTVPAKFRFSELLRLRRQLALPIHSRELCLRGASNASPNDEVPRPDGTPSYESEGRRFESCRAPAEGATENPANRGALILASSFPGSLDHLSLRETPQEGRQGADPEALPGRAGDPLLP
jgi:hypothetical protein